MLAEIIFTNVSHYVTIMQLPKSDVSLFQRKSDGQEGDERYTDEVCHNNQGKPYNRYTCILNHRIR